MHANRHTAFLVSQTPSPWFRSGANALRPIGVFDSGVGGLSVLKAIATRLPEQSLCYVADSAHAPYGDRTPAAILDRAEKLCEFLVRERQAKAIVVACNTATAAAIKELRARYEIPIIGMEPAIKPAVRQTRGGVIGVMATVQTLASERFRQLLQHHAGAARILTQACPGLVEQVEAGDLDGPRTRDLVTRYTQALTRAGVDHIVLGCTHYPFLEPLIRETCGSEVGLLKTAQPVALQLQNRLMEFDLLHAPDNPSLETWTSGPVNHALLHRLWGSNLNIETLPPIYR